MSITTGLSQANRSTPRPSFNRFMTEAIESNERPQVPQAVQWSSSQRTPEFPRFDTVA